MEIDGWDETFDNFDDDDLYDKYANGGGMPAPGGFSSKASRSLPCWQLAPRTSHYHVSREPLTAIGLMCSC
jgi:hypothetical protein